MKIHILLYKVEIYPDSIDEILSHTAKQEIFRPKILCLQALPHIIHKMNHITQELEKENKNKPENEYWYYGTCNVVIDNIPYTITIKLLKKRDRNDPRFYIYFINDPILKSRLDSGTRSPTPILLNLLILLYENIRIVPTPLLLRLTPSLYKT